MRLQLRADVHNRASQRVAENAGFQREGVPVGALQPPPEAARRLRHVLAAGGRGRPGGELARSTDAAIKRLPASAALSDATRRAYRSDLRAFAAWLDRYDLGLDDVDARVLTDYAAELGRGRPRRLARHHRPQLAAVRALLRSALGPARVPDISLSPRLPRRLPHVGKADEVDRELKSLEGEGPIPLRNRALGELVYSAGLRSQEAVGLDLADVDFEQEAVRVLGKGGKDADGALGEEAAHWLARYLRDGRPQLVRGAENALRLGARPAPGHEHGPPRHPPPAPPPSRVRHASPGGRSRLTRDPGAARAQLALDDAGLQPRGRPAPAPCLRSVAPSPVMARIATIALSIAVTLAVPAILVVNGIRLVTNDRYVEAVYDHGGVPDDRYGLRQTSGSAWRWSASARSNPRRRKESTCFAKRGSRTASPCPSTRVK